MHFALREGTAEQERVTASEYRPGCGEDWAAFLEQASIEKSVLFTSEGLSVGLIQIPRYATEVCSAYNDYLYEKFLTIPSSSAISAKPPQLTPAAVSHLNGRMS